jgi:beta-galactosidase
VSSARDQGRAEWPESDPRADLTYSRRAVLRTGLLGATAFSLGNVVLAQPTSAGGEPRAATAIGLHGFNQGWLFGGVYTLGAESPRHSERHFEKVTLPHTVTALSWGDWKPGVWERVWIYRKHIDGSGLAGRRVFVDFQAVMTKASVFLGGLLIAEHEGGYLPWSVELTGNLRASDNVLAVVVDARELNIPPGHTAAGPVSVDFLQPGGIYRDVALRVAPDVLVSDVFAKPTNVLSATPGVDVRIAIDAGYVPRGTVQVSAALLNGTSELGRATDSLTLRRTGETVATLSITGLDGIVLWSPDTPALYQVRATVTAESVSHAIEVNIGFREASFETDGFYLNGERRQITGLNRHQLFPYTGMAAPERLQRRDAEILKTELGCNMVRCSHYPQSQYFLDACDELGLMVWEEPPGWRHVGNGAFQDIVAQNVQDMIVRDRNRPSVILWATRLDETANHSSLWARTRRLAQSLDGSRQTTGAMAVRSTSGWNEDVFAYNDYHSEDGEARLAPPLAGVPYIVSEAVGVRDGAALYRWVDSGATLAQQATMHAEVNEIARSDEAYAGVLAWSEIDYASINGGDRIWHNLKWAGVLDTFRVPKPGAAVYRSQVDPAITPMILPVFFWDFGPRSPSNGPGEGAMIATNCDRLELFLDGDPLISGIPDTQDFAGLAYPPVLVDLSTDGTDLPDLRIDGYVDEQLVCSLQMSSNRAQDRLVLFVEDSTIQGDGTDATRFTFRALDAFGNQRPYPDGDVALTLSGPARLVGENPFSFAEYGGVGGGLIQSMPGASGTITITATHPTLGQASGSVVVEGASAAGGSDSPGSAPPVMNPLAPPTKASVRAALTAALLPHGPASRITKLLHHGGYTFEFKAPFSGRLAIGWYLGSDGDSAKQYPKGKLIAKGVAATKRAGGVQAKITLTRRGHRLLSHADNQRLIARASFTPSGRSTTTASRVINLKR